MYSRNPSLKILQTTTVAKRLKKYNFGHYTLLKEHLDTCGQMGFYETGWCKYLRIKDSLLFHLQYNYYI